MTDPVGLNERQWDGLGPPLSEHLALKMASSAQPSLTRLLRRLEQSGPLTLKAGHEPLMKTAPLQGIYFTTVSQCYRV